MAQLLLYEAASGYALFEVAALDEIGVSVDAVRSSVTDLSRFGKAVKLTAFRPFASAANALEQINAVSESRVRIARWGVGEGVGRVLSPTLLVESGIRKCARTGSII